MRLMSATRAAAQILLIDDHALIRSGLRMVVQSGVPGAVLREAVSIAEAIAAVRAALGFDVPALLITGDTAPERLREAEASGVALLHKPVAPADLYRAILIVLE